jgi:hypothetical protein
MSDINVGIVDEVYRLALLEAAQRVSDEEWP